jgi:hypothetical protein
LGRCLEENCETVFLRKGEGTQQDTDEEREYPGQGTQAQAQGEDHTRRGALGLPETAKGEPKVLPQILDRPGAARFPGLLPVVLLPSESDPSPPTSFRWFHSPSHQVPGFHLQVKGHLLCELPVHPFPVEEGPNSE